MDRTGQRLHLAASSGGHLELLVAVLPALAGYERVWVTPESNRARDLEVSGDRLELVSFYGRNPLRLIRQLRQVARLMARERPQVVITTGAGTAVPFCVISWLLGAKVIFVETMARVTNASLSGRILSRLASVTIVQWPEMLDVYRCARLCSPALLNDVDAGTPRGDGGGTFVAVGTHYQPFDRLLSAVDRAVGNEVLPAPATGQAGTSTHSVENVALVPFMSPGEMSQAISQSRYVVCHAGSGIISAALRAGRKPLVMPRLQANNEHVDDHQTQIVGKLSAMDLVVPIEEKITSSDLSAANRPVGELAQPTTDRLPSIEGALSEALRTVLGPGANSTMGTTLDVAGQRPDSRAEQPKRGVNAWTS